jgi:hypothetical protein
MIAYDVYADLKEYFDGNEILAQALLDGNKQNALAQMGLDSPLEFLSIDILIDALKPSEGPSIKTASEIMKNIDWRYGDSYDQLVREESPSWATLSLILDKRCNREEADILVAYWIEKTANTNVDLVEISPSEVIPSDIDDHSDDGETYVVRWKDNIWTGKAYPPSFEQKSRSDAQPRFYHPRSHKQILLSEIGQVWKRVQRNGSIAQK